MDMLFTNGKVNKRFTGSLAELQADSTGRAFLVAMLETRGHKVVPSPEGYSKYDTIAERDGHQIWFEVERRGEYAWPTGQFRFKTMHAPCRKERSQSDYYVQFSHDGTRLGIIEMEKVKGCPTVYAWCSNTQQYEDMYDVPVSMVRFARLAQNGTWEKDEALPCR